MNFCQKKDMILKNSNKVIILNQHLKRDLKSNAFSIDLNEAMSYLVKICDLLQLAYAFSKDSQFSKQTTDLLCRYQNIIKMYSSLKKSLEDGCDSALRYVKAALNIAQITDSFDQSFEMITECLEIAKQMSQKSTSFISEANHLCHLMKNPFDFDIKSHEKEIQLLQHAFDRENQNIKSRYYTIFPNKANLFELENKITNKKQQLDQFKNIMKSLEKAHTIFVEIKTKLEKSAKVLQDLFNEINIANLQSYRNDKNQKIIESECFWQQLKEIYHTALLSINDADSKIDYILSNLLTQSQAVHFIESNADTILSNTLQFN